MADSNSRLRGASPAIALTLAISFLLTLYAPLELYFTNMDEFPFDAYLLLPPLLMMFGAVTVLGLCAFGLCRLIHRRVYHLALCAATIGYVCTFIQGMYMSGNLPPLDGTAIDWSGYLPQHIISIVLWLFVTGLVILLTKKLTMKNMKVVFTACSCFVSAILLVTLVVVGLTNNGFERREYIVGTKDQEFTLSSSENLVVLVIDATDSETFYNMMKTTDPGFADILEDFTYYPNTVGAYPYTKFSIPFILTGEWYENQEDFLTFTTAAMDASPLLSSLRDRNYRMGLYEEESFYDNENVFDFENVKRIRYRVADYPELIKEELKLVWFKYAPFPLKGLVTIYQESFFLLVAPVSDSEVFSPRNYDFYGDLHETAIETVEENCFRFIHIEGAHVPFRYDRYVNIIDESQGTYEQNIQCSMTIVKDYLQKLKDSGTYDNSAILIMADHGYGHNETIPIVGRGNPFLAIKGRNERHALHISDAPISYEDLQSAYLRLLDGSAGDQVFDYKEGEQRERRFLCHFYEAEDHMAEYVQTGDASDSSTMTFTGQEYLRPKHGKGPRKDDPPEDPPQKEHREVPSEPRHDAEKPSPG